MAQYSAQAFSAQAYNRIPQTGPSSRRHPFTNAVNHHQQAPVKPQPTEKRPASPPLPRQNAKITPPSPPSAIRDRNGALLFSRVGFLGEGGFARVYEYKEASGTRIACKVVTISSLKTVKAKTKLYAEIKIQRSLAHPNIVRLRDTHQDSDNVYLLLELCPSGSLMELLRRRRRFTEPEARFFTVQLMGACHYLHTHQVIHRDLKLGNLLLDVNMNLKVGDFGLAALIENPGERKKTICGTPNYIAPEVLFDNINGHSFEVDIWSIGIILYTFLIGRPPFQTPDGKGIYDRIRDNDYNFPSDRSISAHAQALIQEILTPDPQERPTIHEIVNHPFYTQGTVPSYIPTSAHDAPPDFRNISRSQSQNNLKRLKRYALMDEDQVTSIVVPKEPAASAEPGRSITSSVAQQEKEFQKAVQPGSPISALLSSARQPLLMANNSPQPGTTKETPLLRKLQAVKESPLRKSTMHGGMNDMEEDFHGPVGLGRVRDEHLIEEQRVRKKQLEAQKARIVAQMAPVREDDEHVDLKAKSKVQQADREHLKTRAGERENVPPAASTVSLASKGNERERELRTVKEQPPMPASHSSLQSSTRQAYVAPPTKPLPRIAAPAVKSLPVPPAPAPVLVPTRGSGQLLAGLTGFDAAAHVLELAFDAKDAGQLFHDPREDPTQPLHKEHVFIVAWVDYCNKYGMGYALTDGSVGVHFNDSTTVVVSPDKYHFDYITSRRQGAVYLRKSHTVESYPEDLKTKLYLLKHFERYILDRLHGEYDYTYEDTERTRGMEWVQKYLRMKNVIIFKLSHDVVQFNFYDHTKLILSTHGLLITHIDKEYQLTRWALTDVMATALRPEAEVDPEVLKFNQRLVDKLKFCKEVLISIRKASAAGLALPEEAESDTEPMPIRTINAKVSKMSLR